MADESDDLLNPDEIEALLKSSGTPDEAAGGAPKPPAGSAAPPKASPSGPASEGLLDPSEVDQLLKQKETAKRAAPASAGRAAGARSATEKLLDEAEEGLAKAVAPNLDPRPGIPPELGEPENYQFTNFDEDSAKAGGTVGLPALQDVELDLRIELGRTELLIDEVLKLKEGSVVPLDKLAGDPVDILVNGRLIARGEVLVLNDNFCVRVAEILTPDF